MGVLQFLGEYWWISLLAGFFFAGLAIFKHVRGMRNMSRGMMRSMERMSDFPGTNFRRNSRHKSDPFDSMLGNMGGVMIFMIIGGLCMLCATIGIIVAIIEYVKN